MQTNTETKTSTETSTDDALWAVARRELELANTVEADPRYGGETLLPISERNAMGW